MRVPTLDELSRCFQTLEAESFHRTGHLPIVACRQWSPSLEWRAWRDFRAERPNTLEVAFPRAYTFGLPSSLLKLFRCFSLGHFKPELWEKEALRCLFSADGQDLAWSLLSRNDRFVLRSPPQHSEGSDFVYLGDDTLHLMQLCATRLENLKSRSHALRCLDFCCGSGGVGLWLPEFSGTLLGIDLNPIAIELASLAAKAQNLSHYSYRCCDLRDPLEEEPFDLIFGNPPTLDPALTGQDVFYATGDQVLFRAALEFVLKNLKPQGEAILTTFSALRNGVDDRLELVRETLGAERSFQLRRRRVFPLGPGLQLSHNVLLIRPEGSLSSEVVMGEGTRYCWPLPGLQWRRA